MNQNSPMFKRKLESSSHKSQQSTDGAVVRRRFPRHKKSQSRQNQSNNSNNSAQSITSASFAPNAASSSSSKRHEQHKRDDTAQQPNASFNGSNPDEARSIVIDLTTSPSPHKKQTRSKLGIVSHSTPQLNTSPSTSPTNNHSILPPASIIVTHPIPITPLVPPVGTVLHPLSQIPPMHPALAMPQQPLAPVVLPQSQPQQQQHNKKSTWLPRLSPTASSEVSAPSISPILYSPPIASYNNNNNNYHHHPNTFSGKSIRRPSFMPPWGVPQHLPSTPIESMSKDDAEFNSTLSDEIMRFSLWISLTPTERRLRSDVVNRIFNIARRLWPRCNLKTIGSIETNLCLPSSDIDLVVFGAEATRTHYNPLEALGGMIRRCNIANNMQLITRARVPIIKLVDRETGYRVDISFEVTDGVKNTDLIKQYLNSYPQVQPLVLVIKSLLNYYRLNETFSGGIGSYALTILVTYFVQSHPGLSLGEMLTSFFYEFGCTFDYEENGISILRGPRLFSKKERGWAQEFQSNLLSIEDPANPENDVGRGSFEILRIQESFKNAYEEITEPQTDIIYHSSLLCRVIWMTPEVLNRR